MARQPKPKTPRAAKTPKPVGRPSLYSDKMANDICERLAKGEPLARICDDAKMPDFSTVWRWERDNEEFRKLSSHAREIGTHYMADDCITISDGPGEAADKRVRIDTRLRLIGKWNAKNYGDKVAVEHGGEVGLRHEIGEGEAAAKLAALLEAARRRRDDAAEAG